MIFSTFPHTMFIFIGKEISIFKWSTFFTSSAYSCCHILCIIQFCINNFRRNPPTIDVMSRIFNNFIFNRRFSLRIDRLWRFWIIYGMLWFDFFKKHCLWTNKWYEYFSLVNFLKFRVCEFIINCPSKFREFSQYATCC